MRIVGCFLEYDGKFAILYRHSHKPDGDTWGLASGKVKPGERDNDAMLRELYEETGYQASLSELEHIGEFEFISSAGTPYTFITYRVRLTKPHQITIETTAHSEFKWVTPEQCYAMPDLIPDFHELLRLVGNAGPVIDTA